MPRNLPTKIFVRWQEGDEPWLMAYKEIEDLLEAPPDSKVVGCYELKQELLAETKVIKTVKERK